MLFSRSRVACGEIPAASRSSSFTPLESNRPISNWIIIARLSQPWFTLHRRGCHRARNREKFINIPCQLSIHQNATHQCNYIDPQCLSHDLQQ